MTRLLVVGGTGMVGSCVVEQALADARMSRVIALTRRPIESRDRLHNVVIDFSDMPDRAAWWDVDGVISALGTTRATTRSRSLSVDRLRIPARSYNSAQNRFSRSMPLLITESAPEKEIRM
ncbi:NAD(P)H-binding protein [Mesorhizobium sp. M0199]|uniref:NAD(P)H-binding protein n=1 Tax=Mesorhizobium sp. M0199 TaxID=2956911 RepID=UPI003339D587